MESEASFKIGEIVGINLYRCDRTIRQLFIIPPRFHIPPHVHPDVDSIITFIEGDMLFYKEGREIELISPRDRGKTFRINAGVNHGAYTFDAQGVFINEQTWLINPKDGPHLNWVGQPLNFEHSKML